MACQQLWSDYLFLTREMERFVGVDDELFLNLLEQREKLQARIDQERDDWPSTAEGQALLREVSRRNIVIAQSTQAVLHRMKHQQAVSQAYDGYGAGRPVGVRLDQKR